MFKFLTNQRTRYMSITALKVTSRLTTFFIFLRGTVTKHLFLYIKNLYFQLFLLFSYLLDAKMIKMQTMNFLFYF